MPAYTGRQSARRTRSSTSNTSSPDASPVSEAAQSINTRPSTTQRRLTIDPSSSSTANVKTGEAVQSILSARKCWRHIKGKEEAVWPPELEAALIEGLEQYRPAESKSTRVLGRFPMRNKFVADHILATTGIRRTPKQVGSRIQQLRDTNSGKHILKAISDRHYEMMHPGARRGMSDHTMEDHSLPSVSTEYLSPVLPPPPSEVYIQTLPPRAAWHARSLGSYPSALADIHSQDPRPLHKIDPTVTFTASSQSACQSSFRVYKHGNFIYHEVAPVKITPASGSSGGSSPLFMYTTSLVPAYWAQLCAAEDPSSYTIHQELIRTHHAPHTNSVSPYVLLSVVYRFVDATSQPTPPLSPHSSCGDSDIDFITFPAESTLYSFSPVSDNVKSYDHTLGDSGSISGMMHPFDDGYSSIPTTPLDMPVTGLNPWIFSPSALLSPCLPAQSCDSYFDPSSAYGTHVF